MLEIEISKQKIGEAGAKAEGGGVENIVDDFYYNNPENDTTFLCAFVIFTFLIQNLLLASHPRRFRPFHYAQRTPFR